MYIVDNAIFAIYDTIFHSKELFVLAILMRQTFINVTIDRAALKAASISRLVCLDTEDIIKEK